MALLTNIRLGLKGLRGTLAYCEHSYITEENSYLTLGLGREKACTVCSILCRCLLQGSLTEGEGSVQLTYVITSLDLLLLTLQTLFTFLQNKLPQQGGQLY
jgi:hypothetical protein